MIARGQCETYHGMPLKRLPCNHKFTEYIRILFYVRAICYIINHTLHDMWKLFSHLTPISHYHCRPLSHISPFATLFVSILLRFGSFSKKLNKSANHFTGPCINRHESGRQFRRRLKEKCFINIRPIIGPHSVLALFFSVYCLWLEVMNVSWQPPKHVVTSCFYFLLKIFDVSACHFNRLFHPLCFVTLGIVSCWRCLFHLFPFLFKHRCARVINLYHSYLHTVKNRRKKSSWRKKPRRISKNQQSYDSEPERQRKKRTRFEWKQFRKL